MMNNYFPRALAVVLENEGGYVNDRDDAGGETKYGISKRSYPHLDIKNVTKKQAEKIYFFDFWLKYKCDQIRTDVIAIKFFDMCVNMGGARATICLQRAARALGTCIKDDGIMGPITLETVNGMSSKSECLEAAFKSECAGYYRFLAELNRANEKYLNGWLNRAYA